VIPLGDRVRRRRAPWATVALIAAEIFAFVVLLRLPAAEQAAAIERWALVPSALAPLFAGHAAAASQVVRLWSSVFLHSGLLHLLGNLLFLWVFGRTVESAMGGARFLAFFALCGAIAGLVHTLMSPGSTVPTVGASGAISGVMGAYLALHPKAKVRSLVVLVVLPLVFDVPAALWLLAWLALQLLEGARAVAAGPGGGAVGVAWWAHVGGFGAGLLLHRFFLAGGRRASRAP
jgi:membrane associated rhomboid family serine protease